MPATALTVTDAPSKWSQTGAAVTMTALDNGNGNKFLCPSDGLVIVQNPDASPHNVQITSQPLSDTGRTGHVDQAVAAGAVRSFRIVREGWADGDGYVQLPSGQDATLKVGILKYS